MDEGDLIKISKMAEMHGISRQTLILYDKNGLFKPAYTSETGYRYYSVYQIPYLREICFLKEIGIPLSEISGYLKHRSTTSMAMVLDEREQVIDREIDRLTQQRESLRHRRELVEHISTKRKNVNQPFLEWIPERKVVFSPFPDGEMDKSKLHLTLMRAWDKTIDCGMLPSKGFGAIVRLDAIDTDEPLRGAGSIINLPFPNDIDDDDLITLPAGEYVTMYKYAMPYNLGSTRELLAWMDEHGYKPGGDIVDLCLLDAIFYDDQHDEDFCRLEVPIA